MNSSLFLLSVEMVLTCFVGDDGFILQVLEQPVES